MEIINQKSYSKIIKLNPNELLTQTHNANYGGIHYNTKCFRNGYMLLDGSGTSDSSCFYGRTRYRLDNIFGNIPRAIKVKILNTRDLSNPMIRIGYTNELQNIILGNTTTETELYVELPTYPDRPETTGFLMISIGRFNENIGASEQNIEAIENRYGKWFDENIEIYWYFDEYMSDRKYSLIDINTLPSENNNFIYNSEYEYALKLPDNYHPYVDKKTPLLILCHGLSSTISSTQWGSSDDMIDLVNNFVANGYAVIDVQRVTSQDWCNPALVKKYKIAIDDVIQHYNVEVKYIYGASMGCLIALALQQAYNIKAMVISGIRLDFEDRYNQLTNEAKTIVNTNLGLSNGWDKNIVAMYCPTLCEVFDIDNEKVNYKTFPPTLYIEGTTDSGSQTSEAKITAIQRGGNIAQLSLYPGDHHAVCYLLSEGSLEAALNWFVSYK